jgi:hypothetical protein
VTDSPASSKVHYLTNQKEKVSKLKIVDRVKLPVKSAYIVDRNRPIEAGHFFQGEVGKLPGRFPRLLKRRGVESAHRQSERTAERSYGAGVGKGLRIGDPMFHLLSGGQVKTVVGQRINFPVMMALLYTGQGEVKDIILLTEKRDPICRNNRKIQTDREVYCPFHESERFCRHKGHGVPDGGVILKNDKKPLRVLQDLS